MPVSIPLAFWDYALIVCLGPVFLFRLAHWLFDRKLFADAEACKLVDSFYHQYHDSISRIEIRPGRTIGVLHLPPPQEKSSEGFIIFVHGSCARMQQFANQISHFSEAGYEVLSFDALGCGASEKPVGDRLYTTREMYEDLVSLLRKYTVERKVRAVTLIGHSFGGALVSKMAASKDIKTLTKSVVSVCQPSYNPESKKTLGIFKLPISILWLIRPLLGVKARDLLFGPKAGDKLRRQEKEASARNPVHMFRSFYNGTDPTFFDPENLGPDLHVPVLFIAGEHDKLCSPSNVELFSKRFKANSEFVLARGCGHQCMQEDPEQVNEIIDNFLTRK